MAAPLDWSQLGYDPLHVLALDESSSIVVAADAQTGDRVLIHGYRWQATPFAGATDPAYEAWLQQLYCLSPETISPFLDAVTSDQGFYLIQAEPPGRSLEDGAPVDGAMVQKLVLSLAAVVFPRGWTPRQFYLATEPQPRLWPIGFLPREEGLPQRAIALLTPHLAVQDRPRFIHGWDRQYLQTQTPPPATTASPWWELALPMVEAIGLLWLGGFLLWQGGGLPEPQALLGPQAAGDLGGIVFNPSDKEPFNPTLWQLAQSGSCRACNLAGMDLTGADLRGVDLSGANFKGATLKNVNFQGAKLRNVNLQRAYLNGANLSNADLAQANLYGAHLIATNLTNTYLGGATLERADLTGALLKETHFLGANLWHASVDLTLVSARNLQGATLPDGQTLNAE